MKRFTFLLFFFLISFSSPAQYGKVREARSFSGAVQVDSSDYFITGRYIDKTTKKRYAQDMNESMFELVTEINIINIQTNTIKKLFADKPWLVYAIRYGSSGGEWTIYPPLSRMGDISIGSYVLKEQLLFTAIGVDTNNDGVLGVDDVRSIFFCTKNGEGLRQVTPPGLSVAAMALSSDFRYLLITARQDQNKNGELDDEDEVFYRIALDKDITKIKLEAVPGF